MLRTHQLSRADQKRMRLITFTLKHTYSNKAQFPNTGDPLG